MLNELMVFSLAGIVTAAVAMIKFLNTPVNKKTHLNDLCIIATFIAVISSIMYVVKYFNIPNTPNYQDIYFGIIAIISLSILILVLVFAFGILLPKRQGG